MGAGLHKSCGSHCAHCRDAGGGASQSSTAGAAEVQTDFSDEIGQRCPGEADQVHGSALNACPEPTAAAGAVCSPRLGSTDLCSLASEAVDESDRCSATSEQTEDSIPNRDATAAQHFLSAGSAHAVLRKGSGSVDLEKIERPSKKHIARRLMITHTMGMVPSNALQLIVENSGSLAQHYNVLTEKALGKGSFGTVCMAELQATGAQRAVKAIDKRQLKETEYVLKQEIDIMKMIDHPNLLMLHEIFEDEDYLYLVLELCTGGHLLGFRKRQAGGRLTEAKAAVFTQQLLRAVQYLHTHQIVHRDIKAENCLLAAEHSHTANVERIRLKVSDFGLSCVLAPGKFLKRSAGTPTHIAPEVINQKYTDQCDIWSCGVVVYECLGGYLPFLGDSKAELEENICSCAIHFSSNGWVEVSQQGITFVCKLLSRNYKDRYSAKKALRDIWITENVPQPEEVKLASRIIDDLRKFRRRNRVKRAALHVMASMLPESQISDVRKSFIALDTNGDGLFSIKELRERLKLSAHEANDVFRDKNKHASESELHDFTYTEFLAATFDRHSHGNEELYQAAFSSFDKNGDGSISLLELSTGRLLGELGLDELTDAMNELDVNGDMELDYKEFKAMMRQSRVLTPA